MERTPRIAYLSPLAPSRSSVGDYSEELLPYLCQQAQVDVYTDDATAAAQEVGRVYPVYGYRDLNQPERYDQLLYQLADDAALAPIYRHFVRLGGVATLHDLDLPALYATCSADEGAAVPRGLWPWPGSLLGRSPAVRKPLTPVQALARRAAGLVVHSRAARDELQARLPGARVWVVPLGIRRPPIIDPSEARHELQIDQGAFVCLSVGKLEPHKRLHIVLQALARLRERLPHMLYVLVGESRPGYDLRQVAQDLGVAEHVRLVGHVDLPSLYRYMAAADVGLALRNPERRDIPAGLLRMMSMERPV
ncbi:MAG: glycosyltransferase, partial [Anaerolineae bacterium]